MRWLPQVGGGKIRPRNLPWPKVSRLWPQHFVAQKLHGERWRERMVNARLPEERRIY
jgi:hypothetical protein